MTAVATRAPTQVPTWKPLLAQPAIIALLLLAFVVWYNTTTFTDQEAGTMAAGALLRAAGQHFMLTLVSAVIVLAIAVPLGILLTRPATSGAAPAVLAVANIGQAAPPVGVLVLLAALLGLGFWTAIIALVLYAALPVLRNTMIGLQQVDSALVEAGRGMGMSQAAVLFRIELPLAVPVMLAGVRTALVLLAGTAALGGFIAAGGLGELITTGVNLFLPRVLISGALLIALLALFIDWLGRVVETLARPKGL